MEPRCRLRRRRAHPGATRTRSLARSSVSPGEDGADDGAEGSMVGSCGQGAGRGWVGPAVRWFRGRLQRWRGRRGQSRRGRRVSEGNRNVPAANVGSTGSALMTGAYAVDATALRLAAIRLAAGGCVGQAAAVELTNPRRRRGGRRSLAITPGTAANLHRCLEQRELVGPRREAALAAVAVELWPVPPSARRRRPASRGRQAPRPAPGRALSGAGRARSARRAAAGHASGTPPRRAGALISSRARPARRSTPRRARRVETGT